MLSDFEAILFLLFNRQSAVSNHILCSYQINL